MNPYILQDIQQIRTICQQLAQTEQRTAQQISLQPGLQAMAQQESYNAQQLHQVVSLAGRIEQTLVQMQSQSMQQPMQPQFAQPYMPNLYGQNQINQSSLEAVMRAAPPASGSF